MSEEEGRFSRPRLEAFSDGVIAVVITIMVLDLKAPENDRVDDLIKLWPSFLSYLISFLFGAIYWINHHRLIGLARRVTAGLIWANNMLLFSMTLFPFATAYMAATRLSPIATVVYGCVQMGCALSFYVMHNVIAAQHSGEEAFVREQRATFWKHTSSQALYALAIPAGYLSPPVAIAIFVGIGLIYTVPDILNRRIG
jgi:uncharacterized membrane protein